jgi:hypothetical protein
MNNNKKDYCVRTAFKNLRKVSQENQLKHSIGNIEDQLRQRRINTEEYNKTVRLLDLMYKNKEKEGN